MGTKQHFVPRFLLKRFSRNGKQFNLYLIKQGQIKTYVGVDDQAYKVNIYGKDQELEDILANIEGETAAVIRKYVDENRCDLTLEEEGKLKLFLVLQNSRTPFAVNSINDSLDAFFKHTFKHDPIISPYIDKVKLSYRNPYSYHVTMAAQLLPSILDLQYCVVSNNTNEGFLIGQHPAIIINPFLTMFNWPHSYRGLISKGCVIVIPVNSKKAILLYDGMRYKLIKINQEVIANDDDVLLLNKMQFYYTDSCVYFENESFPEIILKKYADDTNSYRISGKAKVNTISKIEKKGIVEEIIEQGINEPREYYSLSFLGMRLSELHKGLGTTRDISREGMRDFSNSFLVKNHKT